VILGKFMERSGVPIGDKSVQKFRLPQPISNGTKEIKCAYLEELIPEDGNFHCDDRGLAKFQWSRATVLDAGPKSETYNTKSEVSSELKEFLLNYGRKNDITIDGEVSSQYFSLRVSELEELAESDNPQLRTSALNLLEIIKDNPNQLLLDEVELCKSLGIDIRTSPTKISLYKSGRVSVQWEAVTRGQKDAEKWAKMAPPADVRKFDLVKKWIESNP
jgi:hypothetical protein